MHKVLLDITAYSTSYTDHLFQLLGNSPIIKGLVNMVFDLVLSPSNKGCCTWRSFPWPKIAPLDGSNLCISGLDLEIIPTRRLYVTITKNKGHREEKNLELSCSG